MELEPKEMATYLVDHTNLAKNKSPAKRDKLIEKLSISIAEYLHAVITAAKVIPEGQAPQPTSRIIKTAEELSGGNHGGRG